MHLKSRRVWVAITDPTSPHRVLGSEAQAALQVWSRLLVSTPFSLWPHPCKWKLQPQPMRWRYKPWQVWMVQHSFPMEELYGFSFKSRWIKRARCGTGWKTICRNTLKLGNSWHSMRSLTALSRAFHVAVDRVSCHQGTGNSAADAASAKGLSMNRAMAMV